MIIARLSKLCLFEWHLVMNFEEHFVTLLNFDLLHAQSFDYQSHLTISLVDCCNFWNVLFHVRQLFAPFSESNFHLFD